MFRDPQFPVHCVTFCGHDNDDARWVIDISGESRLLWRPHCKVGFRVKIFKSNLLLDPLI